VGTFAVSATLANPTDRERRVVLDLLVDTGAPWTMLPADIVRTLSLETRAQRTVALASGERVTYGAGEVAVQLDGEQLVTVFLAGPDGCLPLLGAVTLEQFGLTPDSVRQVLVRVAGLLASLRS
jgi:clan AA aspartic protease